MLNEPPNCYYCGKPVSLPYIHSLGSAARSPLAVAPYLACTVELCLRLLRDVHEFECKYHSRVNWEPDESASSGPLPDQEIEDMVRWTVKTSPGGKT